MKSTKRLRRREFVMHSGLLMAGVACRTVDPHRHVSAAPALIGSARERPRLVQGIQIGDALGERAIVWSRTDRPSRLIVEWDTDEHFSHPRRVHGPHALDSSDYTARVDLTRLPPGLIFSRVYFQSLGNERLLSEPALGRFCVAPQRRDKLRFVWGGDTAGQGYGINPEFGGMRIYETMRKRQPDFFIHSGDTIYADGPILAEKVVEDNKIWRNLVTEEKSKVAETLAEFRGAYKYNLLDENLRRFNAEVPQIWQWDDHEVTNNWSDSKDLSDNTAYTEKNVPLLVARAARAFHEYAPLRLAADHAKGRVFRDIPYGSLLHVFVVDMRSHRGPNSYNRQPTPGADAAFLGTPQIEWLKRGLLGSQAAWKVIAADMPIGLRIPDGKDAEGRNRFEAIANGDGPVLGREHEIAGLLEFIKQRRIRNVVWLTADVHYAAAHYYDPGQARFGEFDPFWEFVAGPLHAGSFGPNDPDDTFGMQVVFQKCPPAPNYSPLGGHQFFGQVDVDHERMKVALVDIDDNTVFEKALERQA